MAITIRRAAERDREAIAALVRSEGMPPLDVDWERFVVANDANGLAGAVELRSHFDGSREVSSLVVRRDARARGIAARLIDALMLFARGRIYMITRARYAPHYEHWGFAPLDATRAPAGVLRNYWSRRLGGMVSRAMRREPAPLVILARPGTA